MKHKILILSMLICLVGSLAYGEAITIENPSFEDPYTGHLNGGQPTGWSVEGTDFGTEVGPFDGLQCMFVGAGSGGNSTLFQLTDHTIAAGDEYTLKFNAKMTWNSGYWPSSYEGSLYYDDGGSRVVLDTVGNSFDAAGWGEGEVYSWIEYTLTVAVNAGDPAIGKKLGFSYTNTSAVTADWGAWAGCDLVSLENANTSIAKTPTPVNGATLVDPGTDFDWSPPPAYTPTGYTMTLRANDPNFAAGGNILEGAAVSPPYDHPTDLLYDTTYYWRIDSINGATTSEGSIWSFTTAPADPVITLDPVSATVADGALASFTVEGVNADTYTWKRESTGATVQTDGAGPSSTLVVTASLATEDYYYCVASNTAGDDTSTSARLLTKRLMSHWDLDGDLMDDFGGFDGAYTDPNALNPNVPAPVFDADGASGQSLSLADGLFVTITGTEDEFNFYPLGFTVSAWVKNPNAGWGGIAGKQNEARTPDVGWVLNHNGDTASATLRQTPGQDYGANVGLTDGDWHLVTEVYDADLGQVRCYVDGILVAQSGEGIFGIDGSDVAMVIGAESSDGASPLTGLVDDVMLWTYPLDPYDVAHVYTDIMTEEFVCVDQIGLDYDLSGPEDVPDCEVDLYDFVEFVSQWLNCNSVPDCK